MAETVLLDGSYYEFEIFILNFLENNEYQVVPISKSNIKYLEITNDLVNMGYVGKVAFTNFYNVLQKLKLFTSFNEAPYMYIYFKNLDFNTTKSGSDEIFLTASLDSGQEYNVNSIEGNLYYEFEELSIARLKRTSVIYLNDGSDILKTPNKTPVEAIKSFFEHGVAESAIIDGTISIALTEIKGEQTDTGTITDITQLTNISNKDSYYSIIEKLYSYAAFSCNLDGYYSPAIIQLDTDHVKKKRKLVIYSLFDTIRNFFDKIKSNPTDETMKDYLIERFNIAQTGDSPYFSDNYLDKYELKRVNYNDVFENKWTTIQLVAESNECNQTVTVEYDKLRAAFENMATKPFASNLPSREKEIYSLKKSSVKEIQYSRPGIDSKLGLIYGCNKVFKSFIFDNLAITFRTKGHPYRAPGKFITIKTDNVDVNSKNKNLSEVDGHWFVISVSHVFENDVYFNDFICVKLNDPARKLSNPPPNPLNQPSATSTTTGGSRGSRGAVNGGDGYPALPTEANGQTTGEGGVLSDLALSEQTRRQDLVNWLASDTESAKKYLNSFTGEGFREEARLQAIRDLDSGDYSSAGRNINLLSEIPRRQAYTLSDNYNFNQEPSLLPPLTN